MAYNGGYGQGDYGQQNYEMKMEQFEGPTDWAQMGAFMNFGGNGYDEGNNDNNAPPPPPPDHSGDPSASKDDKKKRRSRSGMRALVHRC